MKQIDGVEHTINHKTLRIRFQFSPTIVLTLLILLFILIVVEAALRLDPLSLWLPNSNFGGRHSQFERQLARLEKVAVTDGPIDCIFVGSSLVWLDINPGVFEEAYRQETGQKIHCFNFGVEAMPATVTAGLAPILVEQFNPKFLIYGIHTRDMGTPVLDDDAQVILQSPWYRYQQGDFTLTGWLATHSRIYRNADHIPQLLRFDFSSLQDQIYATDFQQHGFDPKMSSKWDVESLPDTQDPGLQGGFSFYGQYQIQEENLEALEELSTLAKKDVQVIVVAMPVHQNFYRFFGEGVKDYDRFIEQVAVTLSRL